MTMLSLAMPRSSIFFSSWPTLIVVLDHAIGILVQPRTSFVVWRHMRVEVHARGIEPQKHRLVGAVLPVDEVECGSEKLVVHRFHPLLGQRAGVLDPLSAVRI